MTRREFGAIATVVGGKRETLTVPLVHVVDRHVAWKPGQIRKFTNQIWPEAVHDFGRCGIEFAARRCRERCFVILPAGRFLRLCNAMP